MKKICLMISLILLNISICYSESVWKGNLVIENDKVFCKDNKGDYLSGWQRIDNEWYYFNEDDMMMTTGWKQFDDKWFYFDENGVMLHDVAKSIDGVNYKFDSDGKYTEISEEELNQLNNYTQPKNNGIISYANINGKNKEECNFEYELFKSTYYMKEITENYVINNKYYFDDSKTLIFYPVYSSNDFISFYVLDIEDLSSASNESTAFVLYCRYSNKNGIWEEYKNFPEFTGRNFETFNNVENERLDDGVKRFSGDFLKLFQSGIEYSNENKLREVPYFDWYFHGWEQLKKGMGFYISLSKDYSTYTKPKLISEWDYRVDLFSIVSAATNVANANPFYSKKQLLQMYGYESLLNEAIAAYPDFQSKYPQFKHINEMN